MLCQAHVVAPALVVAEDGSDLALRDLEETAARRFADPLEARDDRVVVERSVAGHELGARFAVIDDAAAAQVVADARLVVER